MFKFCSRNEGLKMPSDQAFDVSSRGSNPYNLFSPFRQAVSIPVPGMDNVYSDTVEGVWQSLKVINGVTNLSYLQGNGRKRRPGLDQHLEGFRFRDKIVDPITARHLLYVPSYIYFYDRGVMTRLKDKMLDLAQGGKDIYLYDFCWNGDINDPSGSYAHASLLCDLLNERMKVRRG